MAEILRRRRVALAHSIPDELLAALAAEVTSGGAGWFPELDASAVRLRPSRTDVRARCYLHHVDLDDGRQTRPVVVKVRHSHAHLRRQDMFENRPILTPERTMSDRETAEREYDGLQTLHQIFAPRDDPRFGVLRPLASLAEHSAVVLDLVEEPTLRHRLLQTSRTRPGHRPPMDLTPWRNAGGWLRTFHDATDGAALPPRLPRRGDVGTMYRAYATFLAERLGPSSMLTGLEESASDLATAALPVDLPLSTGHGDYVANNMFVRPEGRVTVFDPLLRWQVPRYQDLATLTVGLRVLPIQSATQGLALGRADLTRYASAVLGGYFGADGVPERPVRAFELLVLLDRWSGTVSKQVQGGWRRRRLHDLRVVLATQHYRREVDRVLRLLRS